MLVDDRVVLRASGPPEAEYALFDVEEIELRSSEPGRVREHGYQTTAALAKERLNALGVTAARAREIAAALQPELATAYARGPAMKQLASHLAPAEVLATETYDPTPRLYRGAYVDLAKLATDLARPGAATELQAAHLALVLDGTHDDAKVVLSTDAWTKGRRPGERTHRRPALAGISTLREALLGHARGAPEPTVDDVLPRQDVLALLRTKADAAETDDERALYRSLLGAVTARARPDRGPLADPALWELEQHLDAGRLPGVVEQLERLERTLGRTPGTTYLRGRAALLLHLEPAKLVAERISALALSMTSFQELSLLAAEAWLEAGEPRRAMPYARDLVDAPGIDEGMLIRAQRVLARVVGAAPVREPPKTVADSLPAAPRPPSRIPAALPDAPGPLPVSAPDPLGGSAFGSALSQSPATLTPPGGIEAPPRPATTPGMGAVATPGRPSSKAPPSPSRSPVARPSTAPAGPRPPNLELDLPPPGASFTLDLPGTPPPSATPPSRPARRRMTGARIETVSPKSIDPRAEPDDPPPVVPAIPAPRAPQIDSITLAAAPTPVRGTLRPAVPPPSQAPPRVAGASRPAFAIEASPPPRTPSLAVPAATELAEHLSLPAGAEGELIATSALPATPLEARVICTLLARELGLAYRLERKVELKADISGIEMMQAHLVEAFPERAVRTAEEAREVTRHGALFAEILVRYLDAQWVDVSHEEPGDWVMFVAPDVRIWPFGRVARLIAKGHRERDLVSTFLELRVRAATRPG